jgi:hypothetical protein
LFEAAMKEQRISLDEAIESLAYIRKMIGKSEEKGNGIQGIWSRFVILLVAAFASSILFFAESLSRGAGTAQMLLSSSNEALRIYGISMIAIGAFLGFAIVFCVLTMAAARADEARVSFVDRHLKQLSFVSFGSDLLVKLILLLGVLVSLQPQFVAPLLMIFTADYLFQRRLFAFSYETSTLLGLTLLGLAAVLFLNHNPSLVLPLLCFALLSICSTLVTARELSAALAEVGAPRISVAE